MGTVFIELLFFWDGLLLVGIMGERGKNMTNAGLFGLTGVLPVPPSPWWPAVVQSPGSAHWDVLLSAGTTMSIQSEIIIKIKTSSQHLFI